MSTDPGLPAAPTGPPWSVDVLADLHAGRYSAEVQAQLRRRIAGDQDAMAVLAALDATVDDLSLLPPQRMPQHFVLRLDEALAAESAARTARQTVQIPAQPLPADQVAAATSGPPRFRTPAVGPSAPAHDESDSVSPPDRGRSGTSSEGQGR